MRDNEEKTCFAYQNKGCVILEEMICKKQHCPFFKTEEQFQEDQEKANKQSKKH